MPFFTKCSGLPAGPVPKMTTSYSKPFPFTALFPLSNLPIRFKPGLQDGAFVRSKFVLHFHVPPLVSGMAKPAILLRNCFHLRLFLPFIMTFFDNVPEVLVIMRVRGPMTTITLPVFFRRMTKTFYSPGADEMTLPAFPAKHSVVLIQMTLRAFQLAIEQRVIHVRYVCFQSTVLFMTFGAEFFCFVKAKFRIYVYDIAKIMAMEAIILRRSSPWNMTVVAPGYISSMAAA